MFSSEPPADKRPSVAEILAHKSYPDTIWKLTPTKRGKLPVGKGRGGPFGIDWEVHGSGETKVVVSRGFGATRCVRRITCECMSGFEGGGMKSRELEALEMILMT